jgi:hypothetical protein
MKGRCKKWIIAALVLSAMPLQAAEERKGRFSLGVFGGKAWTIETSAATGESTDWPETKFDNSETWGGHFGYLWEIFPDTLGGVELMAQTMEFNFTEQGYKYGEISAVPIMLLIKLQRFPHAPRGLGGHLDVGGGVVSSDFNAGPYFDSGASSSTVDTDLSAAWTIAGGLDYFITEHLAVSGTVRFLWSSIDTTWVNEGGSRPGQLDLTKLIIHNTQFVIGLQGYF